MEIKSPKSQSFALKFKVRSKGNSIWAKRSRTAFNISHFTIEHGGFYSKSSSGPLGSLTIFGDKAEEMPWDVYTDKGIEESLMKAIGGQFNIESLCWSEQGMQNDGAWNFDVRFHKDGFKVSNP